MAKPRDVMPIGLKKPKKKPRVCRAFLVNYLILLESGGGGGGNRIATAPTTPNPSQTRRLRRRLVS